MKSKRAGQISRRGERKIKMKLTLREEHYEMEERKCGGIVRHATVIFRDNKFLRCGYSLSSKIIYNLEDWIFLKALANEIIALEESKECQG